MKNTESEFSSYGNPMENSFNAQFTDQTSLLKSRSESLAENPSLNLYPLHAKENCSFPPKFKQLKISIGEILLAIILALSDYWLWKHWVIINYDFNLQQEGIIAHLFRVQPLPASCTIILIGISLLCMIDAIHKIARNLVRPNSIIR